jgi:hypothetical protein
MLKSAAPGPEHNSSQVSGFEFIRRFGPVAGLMAIRSPNRRRRQHRPVPEPRSRLIGNAAPPEPLFSNPNDE